jgi:formylglycine-generating enzyme required for sulfatase activity
LMNTMNHNAYGLATKYDSYHRSKFSNLPRWMLLTIFIVSGNACIPVFATDEHLLSDPSVQSGEKESAAPESNPLAESLNRLMSDMVDLPGGQTLIGDNGGLFSNAKHNESPEHVVMVAPFRIGRYEVTRDQWFDAMGTKPWADSHCESNCPVDNVSWDDAKAFIAIVSDLTGRALRLPTEVEWEYAARASTLDIDHANCLNCQSSDSRGLMPVGQFPPNAFGLHDFQGNVWEWVEDSYTASFTYAPDPASRTKVLRGGSYLTPKAYLRPTYRNREAQMVRMISNGFRVAESIQSVDKR